MLIPLAQDGRPLTPYGTAAAPEYLRFQYFPDSITSTKAPTLSSKEIPGMNLPIYGWISGGEHLINFTASFSCDIDLTELQVGRGENVREVLARRGLEQDNVDIRAAVAWLRQYTLASYFETENSIRTVPPPPVRLHIPNSGIGVLAGIGGVASSPDSVTGYLRTADPTYAAYFPSGLPRVASVSISLAQTAQLGGVIRPPSADRMARYVSGDSGGAGGSYGYRLRASAREGRRT
jgi:hypothetical protein